MEGDSSFGNLPIPVIVTENGQSQKSANNRNDSDRNGKYPSYSDILRHGPRKVETLRVKIQNSKVGSCEKV